MLKNIQGRTREEIEEDKSITTKEKNRINALLDLGIKPAENKEKATEEEWQYKYDLLKGLIEAKGSYYGLTEDTVKKEQEKLRKSGGITSRRC